MKEYRPLLLQTLDVRMPGLRLLRLRLNRHLPDADRLEEHRHKFHQTLCYLSGRGELRAGGKAHDVRPGSLALIPPGATHGFRETFGRRPLAVAVDFVMEKPATSEVRIIQMGSSDTARLRRHLAAIAHIHKPAAPDSRLVAASEVLAILDIQLRALGVLASSPSYTPPYVRKFLALLADESNNDVPVSRLAARAGYQPDYLNRKFKESTGLTLQQQRDSLRLEKARRALNSGLPVADAAQRAGFVDANYFTRWFKRQTGLPPSRYKG
ncbi:MAG: AraC family transcriptional regulator [Terrimicrobiaceae bacterium]